jgi:hypothetical protein
MNLKHWTQYDDPRDDDLAAKYIAAYEDAPPPSTGNMPIQKQVHWTLHAHAKATVALVRALVTAEALAVSPTI